MEGLDPKVFLDYGALGILLAVIFLNYLKDRAYNKTFKEFGNAIGELSKQIAVSNNNHQSTIDALERNSRIVGEAKVVMDSCKIKKPYANN